MARFVVANYPMIAVLIAIAGFDAAVVSSRVQRALETELQHQVCIVLTLVHMGLLALWAGMGRTRAVVRLPTAMIGIWAWQWFIYFGFGNSNEGRFLPASVCVYMAGTLTGLLLVLRAFEVSLVRSPGIRRNGGELSGKLGGSAEPPLGLSEGAGVRASESTRPPQFSLRELFEAIGAIGVVLIVAKYCLWFPPGRAEFGDGATERSLYFAYWGIVNLVPLCCIQTLAFAWIALAQRPPLSGLALVASLIAAAAIGWDASDAACVALDALSLLGPLLVFRLCGYRLVNANLLTAYAVAK